MEELIEDCKREIPKTFEGEEYQKKKAEAIKEFTERRNRIFSDLQERASDLDHSIQVSSAGVAAMPILDGEPLSSEQFEELDEERKKQFQEKGEKVREMVTDALAEVRKLEKEAKQGAARIDREIALFAVGHLVQDLADRYEDQPRVVRHLESVQKDIIDNIDRIKNGEERKQEILGVQVGTDDVFDRYRVNVVVDHSGTEGAPVVDERNPTYYNLFGRLEYRSQLGGMTTDFTMIKTGAFQRAAGGYLILQILDVLRHPLAWEGLKRSIRKGEVKIENMWEQYRTIPAATLRPEPIPTKVKVVLIGSPVFYHLLYSFDEDFRRLFKIKADFDTEMDLTGDHLRRYGGFVAARCAESSLPPFGKDAVGRLAEYGLRLSGHQDRLCTCFLDIADITAEAGRLAEREEAGTVTADHVRRVIEDRRRRSRMLEDKVQRLIEEDTIIIDTEDAVPGQVNGLGVIDLGSYRFGRPNRITCVTSVGRAGVVNIERETKLSGSIHDKGVLILNGFLARRFGQDKPLSLSASLCFEQSYSQVEGDSASCAELYALLSSLADLPLRQDIAVTGSVNQRGQVQPVGGVNEKIEGFFDVCQRKGLTGSQGVLIPSRNVANLMVREDVIEAARKGDFHVYAVDTIEEGIGILTGRESGGRGEDGAYPEDSVFGRIDRRLRAIAETLMKFSPLPPSDTDALESAKGNGDR